MEPAGTDYGQQVGLQRNYLLHSWYKPQCQNHCSCAIRIDNALPLAAGAGCGDGFDVVGWGSELLGAGDDAFRCATADDAVFPSCAALRTRAVSGAEGDTRFNASS